jgi:hypothetical protein
MKLSKDTRGKLVGMALGLASLAAGGGFAGYVAAVKEGAVQATKIEAHEKRLDGADERMLRIENRVNYTAEGMARLEALWGTRPQ